MIPVIVIGDVINDILAKSHSEATYNSDTRATIKIVPGGSAANTATWLGAVGGDVSLIARVGTRDASVHEDAVSQYGVKPVFALDEDCETGSIVIVIDETGRRTMFTDRGANLRLTSDDVPSELLTAPGHLHLTGYTLFEPHLREVAADIMARAKQAGMTISLDPSSIAFIREVGVTEFLELCTDVDVFLPNGEEATYLAEVSDVEDAVRVLSEHAGCVAATDEERGAIVAIRGGDPVRVPTTTVDVVDTTGAGDAFNAGFLTAWLADKPLEEAAHAGMALASQAVASLGARPPDNHAPSRGQSAV